MKCTSCDGRIRILQTFEAGTGCRTSSATCSDCSMSYTLMQVVVSCAKGKQKKFKGAYSLAKKIQRRPPTIELD